MSVSVSEGEITGKLCCRHGNKFGNKFEGELTKKPKSMKKSQTNQLQLCSILEHNTCTQVSTVTSQQYGWLWGWIVERNLFVVVYETW